MSKNGRKVTDSDYHRNGVVGEGFYVGIIRDDDGTDKLFVTFADYDEEGYLDPTCAYRNPKTAILDLGLLAEKKIAFGLNSYRGDRYHDLIMGHLVKKEKEDIEKVKAGVPTKPHPDSPRVDIRELFHLHKPTENQ